VSQIHADHVNVSIEGIPILHDVSFAVEAGTWVGLLGPNGSGKTTLLRTLNGLLPYAGTLTLHNRPVHAWKPRDLAQTMAVVRQSTPLSFDFTVEELVLLGRAPHKSWLDRTTRQDSNLVQQALARVDLEGFAHRSVLSLSGGERQRVFLAQALVQSAALLLLDEPTTHLDVHYQFGFLNVVRDLVTAGRTVIAVFHNLEQAARFSDHLLVLDHGRLVASGAPDSVLTPDLLSQVFRMQAQVDVDPDGTLRIFYEHPVAP